jgi:hypothetical protein
MEHRYHLGAMLPDRVVVRYTKLLRVSIRLSERWQQLPE